jgi:signal transduction histidine kinase
LAEDFQVMADPGRLEQVFVNLLVNAYKYGGPVVTVAARAEGERVSVEVTDNGEGVPESLVPALFDPFTRGRSEVIGSGLGLAIVKRLVEAFGGDVGYEGAEGEGARFTITLDRAT